MRLAKSVTAEKIDQIPDKARRRHFTSVNLNN